MAVKQISVFVQNEKGALAEVLKEIAAGGIELRALSIADTNDFGILRIITNDEAKTEKLLKDSGYICNVTDVVAACVDDKPGALAKEMAVLTEAGVEVEYLYAFVTAGNEACVVLRVNDTKLAEDTLASAGVKLLQESDIVNM